MSIEKDFVGLIQKDDLDGLRSFLIQHPEMAEKTYIGSQEGSTDGFALHFAAHFNRPKIIEFLVLEKNADVNRQGGVKSSFSPLHEAKRKDAHAAAAMLVSLGANPALKKADGEDTTSFCQSEKVQRLLDPSYNEKIRAKKEKMKAEKIAGNWSRTTPKEVMHAYEQPDRGYLLTDTFNFESRQFMSIVENSKGSLSHTIRFFDEMADKTVLYQALERLKDLGGDADESLIDRPASIKRVLKPGS